MATCSPRVLCRTSAGRWGGPADNAPTHVPTALTAATWQRARPRGPCTCGVCSRGRWRRFSPNTTGNCSWGPGRVPPSRPPCCGVHGLLPRVVREVTPIPKHCPPLSPPPAARPSTLWPGPPPAPTWSVWTRAARLCYGRTTDAAGGLGGSPVLGLHAQGWRCRWPVLAEPGEERRAWPLRRRYTTGSVFHTSVRGARLPASSLDASAKSFPVLPLCSPTPGLRPALLELWDLPSSSCSFVLAAPPVPRTTERHCAPLATSLATLRPGLGVCRSVPEA